jgi:hypothetical protein
MTDSSSDPRDTVGQDPQKGRKPEATPAGVNRIDMAEQGPDMASTPSGNVSVEGAHHDPIGDPAEAGPSSRPPLPNDERTTP